MTIVFALLVLAVITMGVLMVLKAPGGTEGDNGTSPQALVADDMPDPVTAADLRQLRLPLAFRGYRMDEVDALLAKLTAQLSAQNPPVDPLSPPPPPETERT